MSFHSVEFRVQKRVELLRVILCVPRNRHLVHIRRHRHPLLVLMSVVRALMYLADCCTRSPELATFSEKSRFVLLFNEVFWF